MIAIWVVGAAAVVWLIWKAWRGHLRRPLTPEERAANEKEMATLQGMMDSIALDLEDLDKQIAATDDPEEADRLSDRVDELTDQYEELEEQCDELAWRNEQF